MLKCSILWRAVMGVALNETGQFHFRMWLDNDSLGAFCFWVHGFWKYKTILWTVSDFYISGYQSPLLSKNPLLIGLLEDEVAWACSYLHGWITDGGFWEDWLPCLMPLRVKTITPCCSHLLAELCLPPDKQRRIKMASCIHVTLVT